MNGGFEISNVSAETNRATSYKNYLRCTNNFKVSTSINNNYTEVMPRYHNYAIILKHQHITTFHQNSVKRNQITIFKLADSSPTHAAVCKGDGLIHRVKDATDFMRWDVEEGQSLVLQRTFVSK